MSETVQVIDDATDVAVNEADTQQPVAVIMELRAVGVSPAGSLFDQFPPRQEHRTRLNFFRRNRLLLLLFVLPSLLACIYFGFIASDLYVTETKFIVRMSAAGDTSGIASLVQSQGLSRAVDETYAVDEYMVSRDVIPLLDKDGALRKAYNRPEADIINRFPNFYSRNSSDHFYKYLKNFITVNVDSATGISTMEVASFRPEDSIELATRLLTIGEEFINQLNVRANDDALEFAQQVHLEAVTRVQQIDEELTNYRNKELVLDPTKEVGIAIDNLGKISLQISQLEAKLAQVLAQTPNSPTAASLREQIKSVRGEYNRMQATLVGTDSSLSSKLGRYQSLLLEKELATRALTTAVIGIERAREDAKARRLYLQNVVNPRMPDFPTRPQRLFWILGIAAFSFCVYFLVKTFRDTVLEHQA